MGNRFILMRGGYWLFFLLLWTYLWCVVFRQLEVLIEGGYCWIRVGGSPCWVPCMDDAKMVWT
jgi:hypothetical protein